MHGEVLPMKITGNPASIAVLVIAAGLSLGADFCGRARLETVDNGTFGSLRRYVFALYPNPPGPVQGQDIVQGPLEAGGVRLTLKVYPSADPPPPLYATVVSSDPAVLSVTPDGALVQSGKPGRAELRLVDGHGQVVDAWNIEVTATAAIQIEVG